MLDKLFTSGIRADIMSLLFNNPEEKFYVREIARLINKNPSGVKRELDKLEEMDLALTEKEGNLKYFRLPSFSVNARSISSSLSSSLLTPDGFLLMSLAISLT